jgi:hypothetical protein
MGQINQDVRSQHLRIFNKEEGVLKAILHHCDVNYARRVKAAGTTLSSYLIEPDRILKETFGFTDELLLVISDYETVQPRTMQAIEQVYSERPFKARATPLVYLIVSKAQDVQDFVSAYLAEHPQSRTPIPINSFEIENKERDTWYLRNKLS